MYREAFDYTGPLAAFVYKYLDLLFGRSFFVHVAASSLLILYQAAIFNTLLLRNKAYDENSYLPAFLYMMAMVSVPDLMVLSPQLMSLTFILLALRYVLRRIDNQVTDELFLNSGIFTGVAAMMYLPAAVFFVVFLVALVLFSTAILRRLLLYLFSFLLIFGLCGLYFFWRGDLIYFVDYFLVKNILLSSSTPLQTLPIVYLSAGLGLVFVVSVFKTWSRARMTSFQAKIQQVIWLVFFGGVATFFLSNERALLELVFLIPGVAYFWVHYFILIQKRIWRSVLPVIMIYGLVVYATFSMATWTSGVKVKPIDRPAESMLVLDEELENYLSNPNTSPFFEKELVDEVFEGLNYYEEASNFYLILEKIDPEFIKGEEVRIQKIFSRYPNFARRYQQVATGLYRKN